MEARIQRQFEAVSALLALRGRFANILDLGEQVLPIISNALDVERVSIWKFIDSQQAIECKALYRSDNSGVEAGLILRRDAFPTYFEEVLREKMLVVDDVQCHQATAEFLDTYMIPNGIVSMLDVLLFNSSNEPWGVMCLERVKAQPVEWRSDEKSFGFTAAEFVSLELESFRLKEQLERMAFSQKLESLGRLAGGVAHDFNNILSIINNSCEIVKVTLEENGFISDAKLMNNVARAVDKGARLTQQLVAFTKDGVKSEVVIDIGQEIRDAESMLHSLVTKQTTFHVSIGSRALLTNLDSGVLSQIVVNLVINARDAISGSGTIAIEVADTSLPATFSGDRGDSLESGRGWAKLVVSDNGCGMTEEVRRRCIEPFYTTKPLGSGTGLGLSTVYGLVGKAGGFVEIYSELHKGTAVKIYLPLVRSAELERVEPEAERFGKSVVLVDDDEAVLETTTMLLERFGYRVWPFSSPVKALGFCEASDSKINLVISDVMMPEMSGIELVRKIRERHPAIEIILISGFTAHSLREMSLESSNYSFLSKPFSVRDLRGLVTSKLNLVQSN